MSGRDSKRRARWSVLVLPWHLSDPMDALAAAVPAGVGTTEVLARPGATGNAWADLAELYRPLRDEVARSAEPVLVLSGDCVASLAVLAGIERKGVRPLLVWFDAHGDFHTEATTSSGYLGGLPLAKAVGRGDATLPDALGLVPLPENEVVLVDGRDLDPPEVLALAESGVLHVGLADLVPERLPSRPVVVHVDVDVIDPTALRGLRFPAPGGPGPVAVAAAVRGVAGARQVVALDIAATWDPERVDATDTAGVIADLLSSLDGDQAE